jgi:hypothetical protein
MKKITLAITLVTFANIVAAGGLTDPKVIPPPMVGNGTECEDENKGAESGYSGAFNHYHIALGQSAEKAAKSAKNALSAHAEAQAQTCNTNTKAVTDGNGHAVRDGDGAVVTNTPT